MDTSKKIENFISGKKTELDNEKTGLLPGTLPFVTITTQSGAGGNRLAEILIGHITNSAPGNPALHGWRVFDKSMCQLLLKEEHLAESMHELLQQDYHSQIEEFVRGLWGDTGMQNVAYARLSRQLRTIATVGKVIILGYGGCWATRDLAGGTHVRLVAPLAVRAARMARTLGVDETQVIAQIQHRDKEQRKLLKTHYRIDSADPEHYDLVFNTGRIPLRTVADMIMLRLHSQLDTQIPDGK